MSTPRRFLPLKEAQPPFFAGIDLGGTNIKAGVVDDLGRPLSWHSVETNAQLGPQEGARRMGQAALAAIEQAGLEVDQVARVGLGTPGTMDIPAGMLLDPPNLPGWTNFPVRDEVSRHCGRPVTFANDAGAAAYGEFWVGIGRDMPSMVLFTLGTGIGCGIIVGDLSIDGEHSHGAECGHLIIDYHDDARMCNCGQRGHLEAYASAVSLVKRAHEALAGGRKSSLKMRLETENELTPLVIAEEADQGDAFALELVLDTAAFLGIGIVSVLHTIDPAGVVLGGAMTFGGGNAPLGRQFLDRVRQEVKRRAFPVLAERTSIEFASLGGDAGYIGAAGLARLEHRRLPKG